MEPVESTSLVNPNPTPCLVRHCLAPDNVVEGPLEFPIQKHVCRKLGRLQRENHSFRATRDTYIYIYIYERSSGWNQGRRESLVESASHKRRRDCRGMGREGKGREGVR
jgi:hypothetical protein